MEFQFTDELDFEAPPSAVFAAITDLEGASQWLDKLVSIEKLTEGPFGVGTEWRETRKMFGHEGSEVLEVVAFEAPRRLCLRIDGSKGTTGKGEFIFDYDFVANGAGTTIKTRANITMPGLFAKLFGWLFIGFFKKACTKDLRTLKAHLEKGKVTSS